MSLKSKSIIKKSFRIAIFSLIILIIINLGFNLMNFNIESNGNIELNSAVNSHNYSNIKIRPLASVSTAISTNIGIKYSKNYNNNSDTIYNNIYSAEEILKNGKKIKSDILGKNMLFIKDYHNFVKSDFNKSLKKSKNKKTTLNSIITQLELRYNKANKNATYLISQRKIISERYRKIQQNLINVKNKIKYNYNNNKSEELYNNMDEYYKLKNNETIYNTYILYINDLLGKYLNLNKYNKILLNTLKTNKDIISKDSYIVIPNSGTEILKKYELILTEDQYNKIKKED